MYNLDVGGDQFKDATSRITPFGAFLRKWSLDELPELWNIIIGDMSLVGPRPLPTQYKSRFTQRQWKRHNVLPGLTGLAQINGRKQLSWIQKFSLDVLYTEKLSFCFDFKILLKTLKVVFDTRAAAHSDEMPMPMFRVNTAQNRIFQKKK